MVAQFEEMVMSIATPADHYANWRTAPDAARLCYQHFLWREAYQQNIHPSIDLSGRSDLRIADLGAGHCLWAMQVAEQLPNARVVASDISLGLVPPKQEQPDNFSVTKWSFFDPVPEEWVGAFDLVHVRLVIQVFSGYQDPRPVIKKFVSMLSESMSYFAVISADRMRRARRISSMVRIRLLRP
jgi:hypothetical protein